MAKIMNAADAIDAKLPINVNGYEKFATGMTKRTTVDEIKFAMLAVSDPAFKPEHLDDYVLVEKWQGNERVLDGKNKIYKIVNVWQSLPGDQLSQVKFCIKKRKHILSSNAAKLAQRDCNSPSASVILRDHSSKKFTLCTLSPSMQKSWAVEKAKRKSSYVKRQLRMASQTRCPNKESSSDSEEELNSRFACIRSTSRPRQAAVQQNVQMKKSLIDLVTVQNAVLAKQMNQLSEPAHQVDQVNEDDVKLAFAKSHGFDKKQAREYSTICNNFFKLQSNLDSKLKHIDELKSELDQLQQSQAWPTELVNADTKLRLSVELGKTQSKEIHAMDNALANIDGIIALKTKFIESLEQELDRLEQLESANQHQSSQQKVSLSSYLTTLGDCYHSDNDSDTGISSADSEDLETLV